MRHNPTYTKTQTSSVRNEEQHPVIGEYIWDDEHNTLSPYIYNDKREISYENSTT